ncbi:MAG: 1-phosphofructokinase family hexose kinase [Phototrophicaceae bacterium]|jgi:6-phosphofructokinase 2
MQQTIMTLTMNPAVDVNTTVDRVAPEMKLRCGQAVYEAGGGGVNVSRAIHNLGGESAAWYLAGGTTGRFLEALLAAEQLQQRVIPVQSMTRENFIVYESVTEQQYRFGMPGGIVQSSEWQAVLEALAEIPEPPAYWVLSGSLPPGVPDDFYAQAAQVIAASGSRLVLDTSGQALQAVLDAHAPLFMLKPNLRELAALSGAEDIADDRHQEDAARSLIQDGKCEVVVVSMGARGVLLVTQDITQRFRAPVVPMRSAVGAGDSMVGAITLRLAQGAHIIDATRYGVAAGTAAVMNPGAQLCRLEDVESVYQALLRD